MAYSLQTSLVKVYIVFPSEMGTMKDGCFTVVTIFFVYSIC
jgi:hypothetical protein